MIVLYYLTLGWYLVSAMAPSTRKLDASKLTGDCKFLYDYMSNKFESLTNQFNKINALIIEQNKEKDAIISSMQVKINSLEDTLSKVEERLDDADMHARRDTVIVSGTGVPPCAGANENCMEIIVALFKEKLNIQSFSTGDISVAHRLGSPPKSSSDADRRNIVVKFCRREKKREIFFACKTHRPDFYVNDSLTPLRNSVLYALRSVRRAHPELITGTSSSEGKVSAWIKVVGDDAENPVRRRVFVNTHQQLINFCQDVVKRPLSDFIKEWKH